MEHMPGERAGSDRPLSFAQEDIWTAAHLGGYAGHAVEGLSVRLRGALDHEALTASMRSVLVRHETLRTTFPSMGGRPAAQVHALSRSWSIPLTRIDSLAPRHRARALRARVDAAARAPFDLGRGPLFRVELIQTAAQEHWLILTMHHIVSDGWSAGVLAQELTALYEGAAFGGAPPAPLSVQYADFAREQRERLAAGAYDKNLAYWTRQLEGLSPFRLPTDYPRPAVRVYRGAFEKAILPARLLTRLRSVVQRERASMVMAIVAAFQLVLRHWTGHGDVPVTIPVTTRTRPELERLVGLFLNTVTVRGCSTEPLTFREALESVRRVMLQAYAHSDVPIQLVLRALRARGAGALSLSPVAVVPEIPLTPTHMPAGLELTLQELPLPFAFNELALGIRDSGSLTLRLFYASDLFSSATARGILDAVCFQLREAARDATIPVRHLWPTLATADAIEARETRRDETPTSPDAPLPIDEFEKQVDRAPHAEAIAFPGGELRYDELNAWANHLAAALDDLGLAVDSRIAIYSTDRVQIIVAMLATFKAGHGFVVLDPEWPDRRISDALSDADVSAALIGNDGLRSAVSLPATIAIGTRPPATARAANVRRPRLRSSTAYITYTSGTSGKPSGVLIEQHALATLVRAAGIRYSLSASDRVAQVCSPSFDIVMEEIFPTLSCGGTVVVLSPQMRSSAEAFIEASRQLTITVANLPTRFGSAVIEAAASWHGGGALASLRLLVVGGEQIDAATVRRWRNSAGGAIPLVNAYGPSEATVTATTCDLSGPHSDPEVVTAIGEPLPHLEIHLIDAALTPVAPGETGEIYIGGAALARGYVNQPGLTASRFVPDPFGGHAGARLYRTGDLARYLSSGNLEFRGRKDSQVKVRGYRVEPDEIERVLAEHPSVRACAVTVADAATNPRLVAHISASTGVQSSEVREFLRQRLPDYMVPTAFELLDALPLTATGKIDRLALQARASAPAPARDASPVTEPTSLEDVIAGVWSGVLGVARVGLDDNFFELGGDSILSIQVAAQLAQHGIQATPQEVFLHPTVRQLSGSLARPRENLEPSNEADGRSDLLTPAERRLFAEDLGDLNAWTHSVVLRLGAPVAPAALRDAVSAVLACHPALRLSLTRRSGRWVRRFRSVSESLADGVRFAHPRHAVTAWRAAVTRVRKTINVETGPAFVVLSLRSLADDDHLIAVTAHHLTIDGVSWRLLLDDLRASILAAAVGSSIELAPERTSLSTWCTRLEAYVGGDEFAAEREFWQSALRHTGPSLWKPTLRGDVRASATTRSVKLSREDTARLVERLAERSVTAEDALFAGFLAALRPRARSPEILIDVESHGRDGVLAAGLERTVGWFTCTHPVVVPMTDGYAGWDGVARASRILRAFKPHGKAYELARFGDGSRIHTNASAWPAVDVSWNYLGSFPAIAAHAELSIVSAFLEDRQRPIYPTERRPHAIEGHAWMADGQLVVTVTVPSRAPKAFAHLADAVSEALVALLQDDRRQPPVHLEGWSQTEIAAALHAVGKARAVR